MFICITSFFFSCISIFSLFLVALFNNYRYSPEIANITSHDTSLDIDSGLADLACEPSVYNILDFENKPLISAATAVGCLCFMPLSHLFWLALAKLRV